LGACTGWGVFSSATAGNCMIGGGQYSFQVAGAAFGTGHFHLFPFAHHQYFQVFVTVQAFEFEYGHVVLLKKLPKN
jgi:hypothetical protein